MTPTTSSSRTLRALTAVVALLALAAPAFMAPTAATATATAPTPAEASATGEVVALIETTDGPVVRTFSPQPGEDVDDLLAELRAADEVISASVNRRYSLLAAPVAADDAATVTVEDTVNIDVLANDTDSDGTLDTSSVTIATAPSDGMAVVRSDGLVTYDATGVAAGTHTFGYTVNDNDGETSNEAVVTVTVEEAAAANTAPVAAADGVTATAGQAVTIDVLANDTDADDDALTVDSTTTPTNGTVVNNGTDVTYTSDASHTGTDTFDYTVTDGTDTATATVTVTVEEAVAEATAEFELPCTPDLARMPDDAVLAFLDSAAGDTTGGGTSDPLGEGHKWMYTGEFGTAGACLAEDGTQLVVQVSGVNTLREFDDLRTWSFVFTSPFDGEALEADTYRRAAYFGNSGSGVPGIGVTYLVDATDATSSCSARHYGKFTINELEATGTSVDTLSVSFEDHCGDASAPALNGELRINPTEAFDPQVAATDPYRQAQWALETLGADGVWQRFEQLPNLTCTEPRLASPTAPAALDSDQRCATIAVIDSGVDSANPDLAGMVLPGWYIDQAGEASPEPVPTDPVGHGTRVASVISAVVDNGYGMAGLARWARILPIRLPAEAMTDASIANGILTAVDQDVDVINLSLGGASPGEMEAGRNVILAAVEYAVANNVVVVASSGNNAEDCDELGLEPGPDTYNRCGNTVMYPAALDGVISTGAIARDNTIAPFSTRNQFVDLVAPGVGIVTLGAGGGGSVEPTPEEDTEDEDGTEEDEETPEPTAMRQATFRPQGAVSSIDGTSFAAPYVAATAALAKVYHEHYAAQTKALSPWALAGHLSATADDLGDEGRDDTFGDGLVQPLAALDTEPTVENDAPDAPSLQVPEELVVEADSDDGAVVTFDVTVVRAGEEEPDEDLTAYCFPQSGQTFPVGTTEVACSAHDPDANRTGFATFEVAVEATDGDGTQDGDGDGTPDSEDADAGAGSDTPVPNRVDAGGTPPVEPTGSTPGALASLLALLALAATGAASLQRTGR